MGKAGDAEQAVSRPAPRASSRCRCGAAVGKVVHAKCVAVLLLAVGGFLSAFFLLFHPRASEIIPDDPGILPAEIQAGFILLMPHSELASHARRLEEEIYNQIGVPDSKVSVSMRPYAYTNSTYVTFGFLPDPRNTSISTESMSTLRKSLIQLTLQQMNLSLTPSVFGDTFCLEIMGFPGGITVLLPHSNFHPEPMQPLFNITFELTIHEIREYLDVMKIELQFTLKQTTDEELFVELTNMNGSTVAAPVTVQVSISSNGHSIYLRLYRLKQLAEISTEWKARNLGLNPVIFGRIKDLTLSPLLQGFVPLCAPSLPPSPIPSLSWPPSSDHPKINPDQPLSCPALDKIQNATIPHRKLMRVSATLISTQLPTQLHRRPASRGKKNSIAVAAPTLIAPAPQMK